MRILEARDLTLGYGGLIVVRELSFHVERGEAVALVGANGAGKTSILHGLMRLSPPQAPKLVSGSVHINGRDVSKLPAHRIVLDERTALVPEGRRIFGNLTVEENLELAAEAVLRRGEAGRLGGVEGRIERVYAMFPRLLERRERLGESLSGGEQQMLAVGRAIMTDCSLLLLDEPSMGLSPLLMSELFKTLGLLKADGVSILLVEQNAKKALAFADRALILDSGRIVAQGSSAALAADPALVRAYLGG